MNVPVVVLVGAGASLASGSYPPELRPPLTRDLFTSSMAADLLLRHPLARKAGLRIGRRQREDSTIALEATIAELSTDPHPHRRQMALALPLYLQEYLLEVSKRLHPLAYRYDILVDELLTIPSEIHFVSLNYDVLLDISLATHDPLDAIEDYVAHERWSLVKPHGSVNWYVPEVRYDPAQLPADMDIPEGRVACVPVRTFDLDVIRGTDETHRRALTPGGRLQAPLPNRYPAIALPEGAKDKLVAPADHLDFLRDALRAAPQMDVLVLGYSGIDQEVLELIKSTQTQIRRLTIVNFDAEANLEVFERLLTAGVEAVWPDVHDGTFGEWVETGPLAQWVREFDAPPTTVPPDELRRRLDDRSAAHALTEHHRDEALGGLLSPENLIEAQRGLPRDV